MPCVTFLVSARQDRESDGGGARQRCSKKPERQVLSARVCNNSSSEVNFTPLFTCHVVNIVSYYCCNLSLSFSEFYMFDALKVKVHTPTTAL
jgi:hypothetical protein